MTVVDTRSTADLDAELAELQDNLSLVFTRAKQLWKEAAVRIHPDLQPTAYKLLVHIARTGETNAFHLAEVFELDKSVISRQVRMLEDFGLVTSHADPRDGRLRVLTATATAQASLVRGRGERAQRLRDAVSELTTDEIRLASKVFRLLAEA